ncbi:MAG: hypothetical protein IT532_01935 [Burkholderiales bacterium]|nr:hypothetical protein [Burkholderiales bacterium]
MRKTPLSLALFAAFALAGPAPLLASDDSTSRSPGADPPAGERLPASPGSAQSSGDSSSEQPSVTGASASNDQSATGSQSDTAQSGATSASGNQQGGAAMDGQPGRSGDSAATGRTVTDRMSDEQMSGPGRMSEGMPPDQMSGPGTGGGQEARSDAARIEAWRRWHEQMAQRHMQERDDPSADRAWRGRGPNDEGDRYGRDRWAQDDYYDRGARYRDRGGDCGATAIIAAGVQRPGIRTTASTAMADKAATTIRIAVTGAGRAATDRGRKDRDTPTATIPITVDAPGTGHATVRVGLGTTATAGTGLRGRIGAIAIAGATRATGVPARRDMARRDIVTTGAAGAGMVIDGVRE